MTSTNSGFLFQQGQMLATIAMLNVCKFNIDLGPYIERHLAGDWGDVPHSVKETNNEAAAQGYGVIKSAYHAGGYRFWLVTDAERSQTVAMMPHELNI